MVKHIILWQLKDEIKEEEKQKILTEMKENLEALVEKVPGLLKVDVQIEKLSTSNADAMLYTELESEEALKGYAIHPDHVAVANTYVRPFIKSRTCIDF